MPLISPPRHGYMPCAADYYRFMPLCAMPHVRCHALPFMLPAIADTMPYADVCCHFSPPPMLFDISLMLLADFFRC